MKGITEADTSAIVEASIRQHVRQAGMDNGDRAGYLLDILGCPTDRTYLDQLSPQARRERTFTVLR
jgi:hypothetical protein